jgi:hypothetical protein
VVSLRTAVLLAALLASAACRKKFELLPEGAKQVTRSDTNETGDGGTVALREYRFALGDAKSGTHTFVCESRNFPDAETAKKAAAKSIAERPQSGEQKAQARFASSGRSVWLWRGRELVWCMLTTPRVTDIAIVMQPVVAKFKKQYEEAS